MPADTPNAENHVGYIENVHDHIYPPPNIYIVGKLWIWAFICAYPFTLPKFLQALRILLTPWDSNDHTS